MFFASILFSLFASAIAILLIYILVIIICFCFSAILSVLVLLNQMNMYINRKSKELAVMRINGYTLKETKIFQVRHRRTCCEARAPKELSSARLCDPPEAQLSAGDCHPLLKHICYPPLSALRA